MKFKKGDYIITRITELISVSAETGVVLEVNIESDSYLIQWEGCSIMWQMTYPIDTGYELDKKEMRKTTIETLLNEYIPVIRVTILCICSQGRLPHHINE